MQKNLNLIFNTQSLIKRLEIDEVDEFVVLKSAFIKFLKHFRFLRHSELASQVSFSLSKVFSFIFGTQSTTKTLKICQLP